MNYVTREEVSYLGYVRYVFKITERVSPTGNRYQSTFRHENRLEFMIAEVTLSPTARGISCFKKLSECLKLLASLNNRLSSLVVFECEAYNDGQLQWEDPDDHNSLSVLTQAIRPISVVGTYSELIQDGKIVIPRRYRNG